MTDNSTPPGSENPFGKAERGAHDFNQAYAEPNLDNIGPHGKGCKCPPNQYGVTSQAFWRGDLSNNGRKVYELQYTHEDSSEPNMTIYVKLNSSDLSGLDKTLPALEHLPQDIMSALAAHGREMTTDLLNRMFSGIFGSSDSDDFESKL